ncbi:hypothetical protein PQX77_022415 [Marasmius sp. AFHP31]|nr:hypothetical protein PQX77_022415 [Marasmius sp. AFHP31]
MPPNDFRTLLASLTSLEDLSFGVLGGITGGHLSLFHLTKPDTGDFVIVPKLQNLTLLPVAGSESTYSEDTLTSILEFRRRGAVQPDSRDSTEPPNDGHLVSVVLDRPVKHKRLDSLRAGGLSHLVQNTTMKQLRCSDCNFDIESSRATIQKPPDSLYQHYLSHNGYPPLDQVDLLAPAMNEAKAQVSLLDNTIARMKATIAALEAEQARVVEVVARYQTILRPVHRLPPELLTRIFLVSLDPLIVPENAIARTYPPHSLDSSKVPWTLGQVCRTWRQLALQTPGLWSFISFSLRGDSHTPASQLHAHRLGLQLQRSAAHSLTIITSTPRTLILSAANPTVVLLSHHTDHVKHLRIDLNGQNGPITSLSRGRFQMLETLDIRLLTHVQPLALGAVTTLDGFEFASKLNTLILSGDITGLNLIIPSLQITTFHWCDDDNPTTSSFSSIHNSLASFHNLRSCRLSLHPQTLSSYPSKTLTGWFAFLVGNYKLTLTCLKQLEIACTTQTRPVSNKGILSWIEAPGLTHLNLFSSGHDTETLSRLFPHPEKIVSLFIGHVEMPPKDFFDAIAQLTSLQTLGFGAVDGINNEYLSFLHLTAAESESFSIAPKLRRLVLLAVADCKSEYSDEMIVSVLEARRRGALGAPQKPHLTSVVLDRKISEPLARTRLDRLISSGLDVTELKHT